MNEINKINHLINSEFNKTTYFETKFCVQIQDRRSHLRYGFIMTQNYCIS